jgi:hypothetical protein
VQALSGLSGIRFVATAPPLFSDPECCFFVLSSYLNHMKKSMPAPNAYETFTLGYEDYLEIPLQARRLPVHSSLESHTTAVDVPLLFFQNITAPDGQFGIADV